MYTKSNHRHRGSGDGAFIVPASLDPSFQEMQLVNEFKGFPAYVAPDADLVTLNLWWDDTSTPTTKATFVDVAGEAGITETYEYALKCIGDSSGDGFNQRWTYADEPRVKSGRKFSALFAVWAPAGRIVTCALTTSIPTTVSAVTTTTAAWQIIAVENLTLDGTYVEAICTIDGAGTFYVVPLGALIGTRALALPSRKLEFVAKQSASVYNADPGGGSTFFDIDFTATTEPLAAILLLTVSYTSTVLTVAAARRNGDATALGVVNIVVGANVVSVTARSAPVIVSCDDGNIVEFATNAAGADTETLNVSLNGYWRWA